MEAARYIEKKNVHLNPRAVSTGLVVKRHHNYIFVKQISIVQSVHGTVYGTVQYSTQKIFPGKFSGSWERALDRLE